MTPPWMIAELERQRRERERNRPQLRIDVPERSEDRRPTVRTPSSTTIVIELGADEAPGA